MEINFLSKFALAMFIVGVSATASLPAMATGEDDQGELIRQDRDRDLNRLEAFRQRSGSFQGKYQPKTSAGDNILLSRRTKGMTSKALVSARKISKGKSNPSGQKVSKRAKLPQLSSKAMGFSFYDAATFLNFDGDGDGYYSDFTLEFDADYDNGTAQVFAKVYTSQNGGDWIELFSTDVFAISFDDENDAQSITTVLNFDFPTSNYDILIDLYENGVPGIVATIDSSSDLDLFSLPLEDQAHERASNASDISFVASSLSRDFDGDGFYTELSLEYDIETDYAGDTVYAEVVVIDTEDGSRQFLSSDDFILGNQTEIIDLTFNAGYLPGWYDVQINLINVFTDEVIAGAAQEFSSLKSLPIESLEKDNRFDSFDNNIDIIVDAGSFGWGLGVLSLLTVVGRTRRQL